MQIQPSNWYHWSFSLELHLMLLEKNPGLVNKRCVAQSWEFTLG